MTAIALLYTMSGFIIAADGRTRWDDEATADDVTRGQESDTEQKIFRGVFKGRDIAYALTGFAFNKGKTFNSIQEAQEIVDSLAKSRVQNLYDYIDEFSRSLRNGYNRAKRNGRIEHFGDNPLCPDAEERDTVARVFFAGYFRKHEPSLAIVGLSHENQVMTEPKKTFESPPKTNYFSGSSIAELMCRQRDPRFSKYFFDADRNSSLEQAEKCARGYIEACCDPLALEIDPQCKGIGGHIHIAALTPSGFRWVEPPKYSNQDERPSGNSWLETSD